PHPPTSPLFPYTTLFRSIGAKPMTFTLNQLYKVLKEQVVDGQTDPYQIIVLLKLYEVQTYLSITNHWWSGFTLNANPEKWKALPDRKSTRLNSSHLVISY